MRGALPLGRPPARPRTAVAGRFGQWARFAPERSHSRRVALLKRVLPAIGIALLLLVAVWPRLAPLLERIRLALPAIDLREARELRMLNPRYTGTDRENRPFVLTAAVGQQVPDRDDLMSLEKPRADLKTHAGAVVVVTADTGIYQSKAQLLDLFGNVTMVHENGSKFVTETARLNVADNSAQGDDPVEGHGPQGDIKAQGFRIYNKGDDLLFTGNADLVLRGARPATVAAEPPPAVPKAVAEQAAAVETAAKPELAKAAAAAKKPAPAHHVAARHHRATRHTAHRAAPKKAGGR